MDPISGCLTVTSVSSYTITNNPSADPLDTTRATSNNPYFSEKELDSDVSSSEASSQDSTQHHPLSKNAQPMKRTMSDLTVQDHGKRQDSAADEVQAVLRFDEGTSLHDDQPTTSQSRSSLRPSRPTPHRSSSTSQIRLRSQYHDPASPPAILQEQLITHTKHAARHAVQPTRSGQMRTVSKRVCYTSIRRSGPDVQWYSSTHSSSDADLPESPTQSKEPYPKTAPLKTCLKHKAKSATTSPPSEPREDADTSTGPRILRRVKTVDFEEATKPLLLLSPLPATAKKATDDKMKRDVSKRTGRARPRCPSTPNTKKSALAGTAVTRADVHVIATAFTSDPTSTSAPSPATATPTKQIIESQTTCYEILWDAIPPTPTRRRRTSSLRSSATRGLERVNSKLADWSGTQNAPTLVVFPDDDGYALTDDDDDGEEEDEDGHEEGHTPILAPPNSQHTSATPSRPPSRAASLDGLSPTAAGLNGTSPLLAPHPESAHGGVSRKKPPTSSRKLSNLEDSDVKFRGHRDSVTIAHTRLIRGGGVVPELFAREESVAMGRRRMHARNRAAAGAGVRDLGE
ncbi:hypothetical protein P153DRAFT_381974 [Dothidotthia symphoricarpi CBS 119687]|uniref:Uncharacterized protein n=1 Tax=Dothidotthia symphoricarpi CBS 119687 TaxID=1392245 RepID=A0A6A6AQR3_9PLEO|nr:uncharacterized protein P153DRAFT_381974 [Dothidotthia symphoricarpi CBS 119687]KAF2133543.1 hypothetical protein P153DRAFT_381974 [Dothidotthia symphoricarpi CBS 119687]